MLHSVLFLISIAVLERVVFEFVLKKRFKFSFVGTPVRTALYFLIVTTVLVVLFPKETQELFAFSPVGVGFLFITGTWWIPHIYRETRGRYGKPIPILPLHKDHGLSILLFLQALEECLFQYLYCMFREAYTTSSLSIFYGIPSLDLGIGRNVQNRSRCVIVSPQRTSTGIVYTTILLENRSNEL